MTIEQTKAKAEAAAENWIAASTSKASGYAASKLCEVARQDIPNLCEALEVAKKELRKVHEEFSGRDCIEYYEAEARIDKILEKK